MHQLLGRSARQIRSANRTGKQTIADEDFSFVWLEQNDVTGCVSRAMNYLETQLANPVDLAAAPVLVSWRWLLVLEAHICQLFPCTANLPPLLWTSQLNLFFTQIN